MLIYIAHELTSLLDRTGFWVYNMVVIGSPLQPDDQQGLGFYSRDSGQVNL